MHHDRLPAPRGPAGVGHLYRIAISRDEVSAARSPPLPPGLCLRGLVLSFPPHVNKLTRGSALGWGSAALSEGRAPRTRGASVAPTAQPRPGQRPAPTQHQGPVCLQA